MVRELAAIAKVSEAVIRGRVQAGALEAVSVSTDAPYPEPDPAFALPVLSGEQTAAADRLRDAVAAATFETLLLDGVTGSGKNEVYMEAIAAAVKAGRQTLVLLPEIALTERTEENTYELQSLMRMSYAVFRLKTKKNN